MDNNVNELVYHERQLNEGLEIAKNEYSLRLNRLRDMDGKLNMMLVVFAGYLAFFATILSKNFNDTCNIKISYIILILLLVAIAVVAISVIIGLFPRSYSVLYAESFINLENFKKPMYKFYWDYLCDIYECISSIEKIIKVKLLCLRIASIAQIIAVVLLIIYYAVPLVK